MLLTLAGHDVRVAYGGTTALSVAQAFRPQVAILDIGMPDLDGPSVARALRQEPWGTDIFLVALSGWGQEEHKRQAQAAGFDTHLTKPVDPGDLQALLLAARTPCTPSRAFRDWPARKHGRR
jgi:CheY-like chemotaxis protein